MIYQDCDTGKYYLDRYFNIECNKDGSRKMTREEAINKLHQSVTTGNYTEGGRQGMLDCLEALGLIKFDEPELIEKFCDCSGATACPQGKIGSQMRCKIWVKS